MNTVRPQCSCHGSIRKMPEEKLFLDVQALETNSNEYNETVPRDEDWRKTRERKKRLLVKETNRKRKKRNGGREVASSKLEHLGP